MIIYDYQFVASLTKIVLNAGAYKAPDPNLYYCYHYLLPDDLVAAVAFSQLSVLCCGDEASPDTQDVEGSDSPRAKKQIIMMPRCQIKFIFSYLNNIVHSVL